MKCQIQASEIKERYEEDWSTYVDLPKAEELKKQLKAKDLTIEQLPVQVEQLHKDVCQFRTLYGEIRNSYFTIF